MSPDRAKRVLVAGAGISGLAVAHFIRRKAAAHALPLQVHVLESEKRAGGKFLCRRQDGYLVEGGPNGFLDSKPWTLQLVKDLGMEYALLPSDQSAARRFIFSRGRLHELKAPPAFLLSPILSLPGRLGMVRELFARPTPPGTDTTVAEFGRRRLGREVVERLLDPMVSGIFAGDPERMSLRASFPRIAQLEEQYGGLIKAWRKIAAERRLAKKRGEELAPSSGPSGPGGVLTSFREGVSQLSDRLAADLGPDLILGEGVRSVEVSGAGLKVRTALRSLDCDAIVLAVPADSASGALDGSAPGAARLLSMIPYSPMAVVGLGYEVRDLERVPYGFGYLIPGVEKRRILGALWTSSIFPGSRSPHGRFLIRAMVGGAKDPETPLLGDDELLRVVRQELAETMSLSASPTFSTIFRWERAIPLYTVGHLERLADAEAELPFGVFLAGNAYRGVGINDCVREAETAAAKVVDFLQGR